MIKALLILALLCAPPAETKPAPKKPPVALKLPTKENVPQFLQDISVTIKASYSEGSGVAFSRGGVTYIWTAGHVVSGLRSSREVIDPRTGTKRSIVEFKDAQIVKTLTEGGRTVGRLEIDAEVIRYSNATHGEDLALLRVRKRDFIRRSAVFYLDDKVLSLGTHLYHVGSLLGQTGSNSMTDGILSQHGRLIGKKEFTQATVTAFPGSSGGGTYLEDGRYIGMLVRGTKQQGFNLLIPMKRIRAWAKRAKIEWAIDPRVPMPAQQELDSLPVEEIGTSFEPKVATRETSYPFLIRTIAH